MDTDPAERSGKGLIVMLVIYFSGDTSLSTSALTDDGSLGPMGSVRSHAGKDFDQMKFHCRST